MNPETLISQADYAIDMYKIDYSGTLFLCIKNGFVRAAPASKSSQRTPWCLIVTRTRQKRGLTNAQWTAIGKVLLNLYNKEKQCQIPPKP